MRRLWWRVRASLAQHADRTLVSSDAMARRQLRRERSGYYQGTMPIDACLFCFHSLSDHDRGEECFFCIDGEDLCPCSEYRLPETDREIMRERWLRR